MASRNDVTGDTLVTKKNSKKYRDNWEMIFGDKTQHEEGDSKKEDSEELQED